MTEIKANIKIVIWDLDDTLWEGTLAEGGQVRLIENRAEMIRTLNRRGIVNAICSKNDFEQTKAELVRLGIWEEFVFPKISFSPKGEMIKAMLSEMNLRAENALFIDDNVSNLNEVLFYNPEISVMDAADCDTLLSHKELTGKNDEELSRLKQYRQLEEKTKAQQVYSSNEEFLRSSNIRITFLSYDEEYADRLFELSDRTNQLNFTKNRMTKDELVDLAQNPQYMTELIRAEDNFGDYGIIGFYTLNKGTKELVHFVFSCRIMNMGIEQFVYEHLDMPLLRVVGDVATTIEQRNTGVDYITVVHEAGERYEEDAFSGILTDDSVQHIFALGACDLYHPVAFFAMPNVHFFYECNVFLGNERGVNVGTEYIRSQLEMTPEEKAYCRRHFQNYQLENVFHSQLFSRKWDYVIMSFHDDMVYHVYEHKDNDNLRIVFSPGADFGDTSVINIEGNPQPTYEEQRAWLAEHFAPGHYITPERFYDNLCWIAERLPAETKILLITGPEMDFHRSKMPHCPEVRNQIMACNRMIWRIAEEHPERFAVVDINQCIRTREDVTDYVFHLTAPTAYDLFSLIASVLLDTFPPAKTPIFDRVRKGRKNVLIGEAKLKLFQTLYILMLGNESPYAVSSHRKDAELLGDIVPTIPFEELKGRSDEYFLIVTGLDDYAAVRDLLIGYGYLPQKDFVQMLPTAYHEA